MFQPKHALFGLFSVALLGCTPMATKEFSPELQRSLVPLYVAADMEDSCQNVAWDDNGYKQHESKVLSLAAQAGVTQEEIIAHMNSDDWMTVEEAYFLGFLQQYKIQDLDDYDARICSIAKTEDRKNTDVGKMITVR